jgi:hypothetical protein
MASTIEFIPESTVDDRELKYQLHLSHTLCLDMKYHLSPWTKKSSL